VKQRRLGKYAIEMNLERDCGQLLVQFAQAYRDCRDIEQSKRLMQIIGVLAYEIENLQADIHYISEPIERKYL
jgi:hypothetical protein